MRQVLEREAHSPFYQEGVSYTLLKVTELGLVEAAEVLLEFGAHLSFEGMAVGRALCLTLLLQLAGRGWMVRSWPCKRYLGRKGRGAASSGLRLLLLDLLD